MFDAFGEALYEKNKQFNLTRVPYDECAVRHFVESLLILGFLPVGAKVLDVGCGPGFPSWPIACARPDIAVTALDSSAKLLGFLREWPLPNLTAVQGRAEESSKRERFDVVTGRAVAPVAQQLEVSAALAAVGGIVVPFRTPADLDAIRAFPAEKLGLELEAVETRSLPSGMGERLFPLFRKVSATERKYPRRWAEIKARPLA